jgi:hypothetical protein
MRHVDQGICWLYLEEYAKMIQRMMYEHSIRGLSRPAMLLSLEEAAHLYPWK